jgi:hypothetical protein
MVASWDAPDVQRLLHNDSVELVGHPQADAYADFYPYLHKVVLHRGASDLANDRPPADVTLIATRASLIVRRDLHPAIQYLLLNVARQIHAKQTVLQEANEFPSAEAVNPPLSAAAQQFYKPGVPYFLSNFLKNYLPFWIAEPINQFLIPVLILVGTLGVLTPFVRPVPVLFNWMIQRSIFRLFVAMMTLEAELDAPAGKKNAGKIAVDLDELERQANRLVTGTPPKGGRVKGSDIRRSRRAEMAPPPPGFRCSTGGYDSDCYWKPAYLLPAKPAQRIAALFRRMGLDPSSSLLRSRSSTFR